MLNVSWFRQREYLLEISRALTEQLDLDVVLDKVLRAAMELLGGQAAFIALRQPGGGFVIQAARGIPQPLLPYFNRLLADIPEDASPSSLRVPDLEVILSEIALQTGLPLVQVVALPMGIRRNLIGVLFVFRAYGLPFTLSEREILASFADQAAIAVHNAQHCISNWPRKSGGWMPFWSTVPTG